MRTVTLIVVHCSATREGQSFDFEQCRRAHIRHRRFRDIGVCYEGGLDRQGQPKDTRTLEQKASLVALLRELKRMFPQALIVGHRDLNPMKACPCFEAAKEYLF